MHNTKRVITEGISLVKVDKRQNSLTSLVPVANLAIIHFLILLLHVSHYWGKEVETKFRFKGFTHKGPLSEVT